MSIKFLNQRNWKILFSEFPTYQVELIKEMVDLLPPAGIYSRERICHFLAQIAHETGGFYWDEELASGEEYEGRADLGNTQPGDGKRFKGRGLIQLTGRANYRQYGRWLDLPLEENPELARKPRVALKIALLYWNANDLNYWADKGDLIKITRAINGGMAGYQDRLSWLNRIMTQYDRWLARTHNNI
jgi:putative chitinase